MIGSHQNGNYATGVQILLPDISWVGDRPGTSEYCMGSEDGKVRFFEAISGREVGSYDIAPSGDAVNGVAFSNGRMAVSTRSEVVFLTVPLPGERHIERAVFHGGAHGVIATASGAFVAPLGPEGLLHFKPRDTGPQKARVLNPGVKDFNAYKIISLGPSDRGDVLACAARRSGFTITSLDENGLANSTRRLLVPDVDFVDVCPLTSNVHPYAVAALGLDCSIHLTGDVLRDQTAKAVRFPGVKGRAYRILSAEGHIFLLTSKSLYAILNLGSRFLGGELDNLTRIAWAKDVNWLEIQAVDAFLTFDRQLHVVMSDHIKKIDIKEFMASRGDRQINLARRMTGQSTMPGKMQTKPKEELWEALAPSSSNRVEEFDLAVA